MIATANQLSAADRRRRDALSQAIQRGLVAYMEMGLALCAIRDDRLYRETHDTFDAWCKEVHGLSRSRAHQIIEAADVARDLSTNGEQPPANERQARELAPVPEEFRPDVWREAVETAPEGRVTAQHVREVAAPYVERSTPAPVDPIEAPARTAGNKEPNTIGEALEDLERFLIAKIDNRDDAWILCFRERAIDLLKTI